MRIVLINPNTSPATTDLMVGIARRAADAGVTVEGVTAPFGEPLITTEAALATAAEAVVAAIDGLAGPAPDAIIIAAFGDPALDQARCCSKIPVIGIAEASMLEAAKNGRRFSVATTTPDLVAAIRQCAARYGLAGQLASVRTTTGDAVQVMANPLVLRRALEEAAMTTIAEDGAQAVIIGGGPLAAVADELAGIFSVPIIEPIPAAVRLAQARCRQRA
jgi:Asp/Glu/hydantoin racemase